MYEAEIIGHLLDVTRKKDSFTGPTTPERAELNKQQGKLIAELLSARGLPPYPNDAWDVMYEIWDQIAKEQEHA
jgi:hypothetical protein